MPQQDFDNCRSHRERIRVTLVHHPVRWVDELAKESVGLSYSDINKVCQDFFKDILVYGTEKATLNLLFDYIRNRRKLERSEFLGVY